MPSVQQEVNTSESPGQGVFASLMVATSRKLSPTVGATSCWYVVGILSDVIVGSCSIAVALPTTPFKRELFQLSANGCGYSVIGCSVSLQEHCKPCSCPSFDALIRAAPASLGPEEAKICKIWIKSDLTNTASVSVHAVARWNTHRFASM